MSLKARINSEVWVDAPEHEVMEAFTSEEFELFPLKPGDNPYTNHLRENLHRLNGWVTLKEEKGGTLVGVSIEYPLNSGNDTELSGLELFGEEIPQILDNMKCNLESNRYLGHSGAAFDFDCLTSDTISA